MIKLVLIRHGQSQWNKENRFTGWKDVPLTEQGEAEARKGGQLLKQEGYDFDICYTSVLKRAIKTLWLVQEEMDLMWLPVLRDYRLNERHYGALQGLNKAETAEKYGEEQVHIWRRSYDTPPPPLTKDDERWPGNDPRYAHVPEDKIPLSECLKDNLERTLPYWESTIVPQIRAGKKVLIVAHGNSLRALVKHLDNIPDNEIVKLNIPTGVPLVYELDDNLKPIQHYYLGDPAEIEAAIKGVANQGKAH